MDEAPRPHRRRSGHHRSKHSVDQQAAPDHNTHLLGPDAHPVRLTTPSTAAEVQTAARVSKDWHHLKRKRHRHVSTCLYQEVEHLKLRNMELEDLVIAAEVTNRGLEGELQQAHRRYSELEHLAQHGVASGGIATAVSENDDLRKQLSAYAVEIDVTRIEKQRLEESFMDARLVVDELTAERDELLFSSGRALIELQQSGSGSQQKADSFAAQLVAKDRHLQQLIDAVEPIHRKLTELQEAYVHQTKEFGSFVSAVRKQQQSAELCLQEARIEMVKQHRTSSALHMHLADSSEGHDKSMQLALRTMEDQEVFHRSGLASPKSSVPTSPDGSPKRRREPKSEELSVLLRVLERNIAKEMRLAMEGIVLQKVQDRNHSREPRMVMLSERENLLRWMRPGYKLPVPRKTDSCLDLYEIIRIDFGSMARASVMFNDVHPWHCFSLYTIRRSYDFICPDDEAVRAFVLSISRCCGWAAGAVRSRRAFECQKGWCKVNEYCVGERKTLTRALLDALRITAGHMRPIAAAAVDSQRRGSPVEIASSRTHIADSFGSWEPKDPVSLPSSMESY